MSEPNRLGKKTTNMTVTKHDKSAMMVQMWQRRPGLLVI